MLWIKKRFKSPNNWAQTDLMDRAQELIMRFPYEFMMVEQEHDVLDSTIWIRLPMPELAGLFPGFVEDRVESLTTRPIKLVVEESQFERVFGTLPSRSRRV